MFDGTVDEVGERVALGVFAADDGELDGGDRDRFGVAVFVLYGDFCAASGAVGASAGPSVGFYGAAAAFAFDGFAESLGDGWEVVGGERGGELGRLCGVERHSVSHLR